MNYQTLAEWLETNQPWYLEEPPKANINAIVTSPDGGSEKLMGIKFTKDSKKDETLKNYFRYRVMRAKFCLDPADPFAKTILFNLVLAKNATEHYAWARHHLDNVEKELLQ